MKTQADPLQRIAEQMKTTDEDVETFLSAIPQLADFQVKGCIIVEGYEGLIPSNLAWAKLIAPKGELCIWDQASIIDKGLYPKTHSNLKFQVPQKIEVNKKPYNIIPKQENFMDITKASNTIKMQFLKQFVHNLKSYNELLILLNSKNLLDYASLLSSIRSMYLFVPNTDEGTLKAYEAIKTLRNAGYLSNFFLIETTSTSGLEQKSGATKIKNVAKNHLGLDLEGKIMVLSSIDKKSSEGLFVTSESFKPESSDERCDFLQILSENLLYSIPGSI
jgi:hypothetical protein